MIQAHDRTTQSVNSSPLPLAVLGSMLLLFSAFNVVQAEEHIIDFEKVEIGKPITKWEDQGVEIELAHAPKKSKAVGKITFFPHLGTGHKGVVNAIANEAIPVRVRFEHGAKKVTVKLWASTTSAAFLEAFDEDGKSIGKQAIEKVPVRKAPEERVPMFELSADAPNIAYVEIGGSKPGGFIAIDELRWTSVETKQ